jgi:acyl phosphate:glycerol-3-phosphate acyltransferase
MVDITFYKNIFSSLITYSIYLIPAYLLGSIPFGLILTKLTGYGDIRKSGSGNIGATNVFRKSKFLGGATLLCDLGKGALSVYLCKILLNDYLLEILSGVAVILGHIFPVWLKFKGGKGVATAIGVFFITNWLVGISIAFAWIIAFIIFRISAVGALVAFAAAPILTHFITHDPRLTVANSLICALVIVRHKENIEKIIKDL